MARSQPHLTPVLITTSALASDNMGLGNSKNRLTQRIQENPILRTGFIIAKDENQNCPRQRGTGRIWASQVRPWGPLKSHRPCGHSWDFRAKKSLPRNQAGQRPGHECARGRWRAATTCGAGAGTCVGSPAAGSLCRLLGPEVHLGYSVQS